MGIRKALVELVKEDRKVGWIVAAFAITQLAAIAWDMPGSFSWENDGVAPRDIFGGLALNLTPGSGHRYPLFHYLILGVLCLPILAPAALSAQSWSMDDLMEKVLAVPVMTGCSIVAKVVAVTMSCITVLTLARMARRTFSAEAGRWAALFAATSLSVAYYGRATNLDGPILMWTVLAMDRILRIGEKPTFRNYALFAIFAAAAVGTKDQAYAGFVLVGPVYLLIVPLLKSKPFGEAKLHYKRVLYAALVGALALGLFGGGLLNPTGFLARFAELTGGASQDWKAYEPGLAGLVANIRDIGLSQEAFFWPWPMVVIAWAGIVVAATRKNGKDPLKSRTFRLLPLTAAASSIMAFTLVVGRCEHRFVLPLGLWLAFYGGVCSADLLAWIKRQKPESPKLHKAATAVLGGLIIWGGCHSLEVHLTQWSDGRRQVQEYLAEREPGTVVETYGLLVYQPHFDTSEESPYRVQRVNKRPLNRRNPIIGARELQPPFGAINERRPDVLVIPDGYASRFLPGEATEGRAHSNIHKRAQDDPDATTFFRSAVTDTLDGYRIAFVAEAKLPRWAELLGAEPVVVHGSTARKTWVLERVEDAEQGSHRFH